ncbi:MAG: hypothetical protein WA880_15525 [Ornithinimicrobium sp.]
MVTIYVWWSGDVTGLFMIGVMMLALPVALGAVGFVPGDWGIGRSLDERGG